MSHERIDDLNLPDGYQSYLEQDRHDFAHASYFGQDGAPIGKDAAHQELHARSVESVDDYRKLIGHDQDIDTDDETAAKALEVDLPLKSEAQTRSAEAINEDKINAVMRNISQSAGRRAGLLMEEKDLAAMEAEGYNVSGDRASMHKRRSIRSAKELWDGKDDSLPSREDERKRNGNRDDSKDPNHTIATEASLPKGMLHKHAAELAELLKANPRYKELVEARLAVLQSHVGTNNKQLRSDAIDLERKHLEAKAADASAIAGKNEKPQRLPSVRPVAPRDPGEHATAEQKDKYAQEIKEFERYREENRRNKRILHRFEKGDWRDYGGLNRFADPFRKGLNAVGSELGNTRAKDAELRAARREVASENFEVSDRSVTAARLHLAAEKHLEEFDQRNKTRFINEVNRVSLNEVLAKAIELVDEESAPDRLKQLPDSTGEAYGEPAERFQETQDVLAKSLTEDMFEKDAYPVETEYAAHRYLSRTAEFIRQVDNNIEYTLDPAKKAELEELRANTLADYIRIRFRENQLRIAENLKEFSRSGVAFGRPMPVYHESGGIIATAEPYAILHADGSYQPFENVVDGENVYGGRINADGSPWTDQDTEPYDQLEVPKQPLAELKQLHKDALGEWFRNPTRKNGEIAALLGDTIKDKLEDIANPTNDDKALINKLNFWNGFVVTRSDDSYTIMRDGSLREGHYEERHGVEGKWDYLPDGRHLVYQPDETGNATYLVAAYDKYNNRVQPA